MYLNFFFLNVESVNVHIVGLIDELVKKLNKRLIDQNRDINREYGSFLSSSIFVLSPLQIFFLSCTVCVDNMMRYRPKFTKILTILITLLN